MTTTEPKAGGSPVAELEQVERWLAGSTRMAEDGTARLQLKLGNLHCSFCVSTIEKALGRLEGVEAVSVSLAHEEGLVTYRPELLRAQQIVDTLRAVGYSVRDPRRVDAFEEEEREVKGQRDRFQGALALTAATLGLMSFKWVSGHPLSATIAGHIFAYGPWLILGMAATVMFVIGRPIMKMAVQSLRRGIFNQHVLLEAGALGGMAGGLLGLFVAPSLFPAGDFLSVAVFITNYHLLSGYASALVRTSASAAVRRLLALQPDTARVVRQDEEIEVPVGDVGVGERVRVRPGERVPLDGFIVEGLSAIDESMVTGEPIQSAKKVGDEVIGGSVNQAGSFVFEVSRVGEDAFLAQVARHIEEARALKPGLIQFVDTILKIYVPAVLGAAGLAFVSWTLLAWAASGDVDLSKVIFATLAALIMGYPCALGMATPLAMMRGGGMAAERGILMRSGEAFQVLGDIDIAVLDKTGTLTAGKPQVVKLVAADGIDENEVLSLAAAAEISSEHPLARAVVSAAEEQEVELPDATDFAAETGQGVQATVEGAAVRVGKPTWVSPGGLGTLLERQVAMERAAATVVAVAVGTKVLGLIGIADSVKPDAAEAVGRLKNAGIRPVMVTGDNQATARAVAAQVGIDGVEAAVLPGGKAEIIRRFQAEGHRVLMVGDGINDAPALAQADIGMAMGAGTDIAIESADVVLVGERLSTVAEARDIGANSFHKTKQNLAIAFSFNGIGVPLAVAGVIGPVWAMVAMISSVSVVLANSFAVKLTGRLPFDIVRFLGHSASEGIGMLRPSRLRHWAIGPRAAALAGLLMASFAVGAIWVVVLGGPAPGRL